MKTTENPTCRSKEPTEVGTGPTGEGFRSLAGRVDDVLDAGLLLCKEIVSREDTLPPRPVAGGLDSLGEEGRELEEVLEALRRVILGTPSSASPRFVNQLFGGRDPIATLAEVVTALTNTPMYTFKAAGPQVLIEHALLERMAAKAGFVDGEGAFTPGGSLANLVAMVVARNEAEEGLREHGIDGTTLTTYTSDEGHYSTRKNAGILGLGRANLRQVASDEAGRMDAGDLRRQIAADRRQGLRPVFITATAGTTVLGAFDPIREIAAVAREAGVWLHVDGALGGSVLLSSRHRHLLDGVDLADSLSWNAHKMMGVPLSCSVILLKRRGLLARSFSEPASYLFQADDDELNPGIRSIQCGRRNDALKLWAAWLYHGDRGYEARVDRLFALARHAAARIGDDPELELTLWPQSVNVCFEVRGRSSARICDRLDAEARLKIGHGLAFSRRAIRLVCVNPDLDEAAVDRILDEIKLVARDLPEEDNALPA